MMGLAIFGPPAIGFALVMFASLGWNILFDGTDATAKSGKVGAFSYFASMACLLFGAIGCAIQAYLTAATDG